MNIWSVCTPKINRMFPTLMTVNIQSVHQSVSQFILLTRHTKATISSSCCVLIPKLPSLWLNEHLIPMLSSHPQGTIIMAESNRYCHSGLTSWWCHPDGAILMVSWRWWQAACSWLRRSFWPGQAFQRNGKWARPFYELWVELYNKITDKLLWLYFTMHHCVLNCQIALQKAIHLAIHALIMH